MMKILIGTPIHEVKDYCMKRWVKNVSHLKYPADLLLVDNSPTPDYVEKVRGYCKKYGITNYKIVHIDLPPEQKVFERVARSREVIRQEILSHDYNVWFSWECDEIIPTDTLDEMVKLMQSGNFSLVNHIVMFREIPDQPCSTPLSLSLIKRECLQKYSFILKFGTDPDMPKTWEPSEEWFKYQILRDGGSSLEAYRVIKPIYHLNH